MIGSRELHQVSGGVPQGITAKQQSEQTRRWVRYPVV